MRPLVRQYTHIKIYCGGRSDGSVRKELPCKHENQSVIIAHKKSAVAGYT